MAPYEMERFDVEEGRYANYAEIGHNRWEFVFDFGQIWLEANSGQLCLRVITTPETAQRLYKLLTDALEAYREKYGEIKNLDEMSDNEK